MWQAVQKHRLHTSQQTQRLSMFTSIDECGVAIQRREAGLGSKSVSVTKYATTVNTTQEAKATMPCARCGTSKHSALCECVACVFVFVCAHVCVFVCVCVRVCVCARACTWV